MKELNSKEIKMISNIEEVESKLQEVESKIDSLKQPYRNILYYKYVCNYEIKQIAVKMKISITK